MYGYGLLSRRTSAAARRQNGLVLEAGQPLYGVQVTVAHMAAQCIGNIGLPPMPGRAIAEALQAPPPPDGTTLVTCKPNLTALGAMAILGLRAERGWNRCPGPVHNRAQALPLADGSDWRPGMDPEQVSYLDALAIQARNREWQLADRVEAVRRFLASGRVPDRSAAAARVREHRAHQASLASQVDIVGNGLVALLESSSHRAIEVALWMAPVAVIVNPGQAPTGMRRIVVCQSHPPSVDLGRVATVLARLEAGWAGTRDLIGSRRVRPCTLNVATVIEAVVTSPLRR